MRIPSNTIVATCLAGAMLLALYWAGLQGAFFFDDEPSILYAEGVRLKSLDADSLQDALTSGRSGPSGRPVAQLSFALNHYFSGFNPFAFKATNLAIHALCGLLVFWLAWRLHNTLAPAMPERRRIILSGLLAAIWLLHPLQLTPVLHAVQRMTSLSALFLLAALLCHIIARERGGRAGWAGLVLAWGLLWPLSFFSKESGVLFPLFALAWELVIRRRAQAGLDRFARVFAVLSGLTFLGAAAYMFAPAGQWLWLGYDYRPFSLAERLLTEGRVLWFYLSLILLPRPGAFGLHHDDIAVSSGLLEPWTTLPSWLGLAGLAWLAWRTHSKAPLVSFGITWFLVGHLLESSVLPLELAHEHRNYLPSIGVLLACTAGLSRLMQGAGHARALGLSLAAAWLIYLPILTAMRAYQFGDEIRRTQTEALHHPGSARAQYDAGRAFSALADARQPGSRDYALARAYFQRAGELDSAFKFGWIGLMYLNCRAGRAVDEDWVKELTRRLHDTAFGPGDGTALFMLKELSISGDICLGKPEIEQLFSAALANPTIPHHIRGDAYSWLADYYVLSARDLLAARLALERARAITPYNPGILLQQAQLAYLEGRRDEARDLLDLLQKLSLRHTDKAILSMLQFCLSDSHAEKACKGR